MKRYSGDLGHVFNGYDNSRVRMDLRKTSRTPRVKGRADSELQPQS